MPLKVSDLKGIAFTLRRLRPELSSFYSYNVLILRRHTVQTELCPRDPGVALNVERIQCGMWNYIALLQYGVCGFDYCCAIEDVDDVQRENYYSENLPTLRRFLQSVLC